MGLRLRKSVKLPLGFRVNFSQKGVGYSWGTRGYRKTVTAEGKLRTTYSVPGTGVSYVKEEKIDGGRRQKSTPTAADHSKVTKGRNNAVIIAVVAIFLLSVGFTSL